jgi:hypothetical protein
VLARLAVFELRAKQKKIDIPCLIRRCTIQHLLKLFSVIYICIIFINLGLESGFGWWENCALTTGPQSHSMIGRCILFFFTTLVIHEVFVQIQI